LADVPRPGLLNLRKIAREETDDKKIVQRVAPLAQKFAATPGLV